jgi:hypothetical protein
MKYDAITLDSNVFHTNGFYLEGGLLGQLSQFREGSATFVLSEIVVREVFKYLKIEAKQARDGLAQTVKAATKNAILPEAELKTLRSAQETMLSPSDSARNRLKAFESTTGLQIVLAHDADMKELIRRYFTPLPPFEDSGKKKHEFPDAIALLTLEEWAKKENKKILAISKDEGWGAFAKASKHIDVEVDLATALQTLQQHATQAQGHVAALLTAMDAGQQADLLEQIVDGVADAVNDITIDADGSSAYHYETDSAELTFESVMFVNEAGKYEFAIVQTGHNKIVANVRVLVTVKAHGEFSLSVYDSIDKEYVPMGSTSTTVETDFEAGALITFEGDFSASPPEVTVSNLELVDVIDSVDFGDISPDYRDEE